MLYLNKLFESVSGVGDWAFLIRDTALTSLGGRFKLKLLINQLYEVGILSLPLITVTGFATGLVLAAQSFYQMGDKGLASATGLFVAKSMLTEVGPSLTAFMITGRVGSAMCAVLGTMKVTEQIDALKSMAISPLRYLVFPRVLATLIMVPLLNVFSAIMGIYGGYLISTFLFGLSGQAYFEPIPIHVTPFDFWMGIVKAFVFAFFISTIACYKGLSVKGGAEGVGRSITSSVVISYSVILIANFFLTIGLNLFVS